MTRQITGRVSAGFLAIAVLLALIPPLTHAWSDGRGLLEAIWSMLRTFTIITNLLVGLVFARIAWKGTLAVPPIIIGGVMLAIVLVGVVFNLLLSMLPHQTIWDAIGDYIQHLATPILVPLWWLCFYPHGRLRWSAPFFWALYPLAYSAYTFFRAQLMPIGTGINSRYPYFFMDLDKFGPSAVALNLSVISVGFVLVGMLFVFVDRTFTPEFEMHKRG